MHLERQLGGREKRWVLKLKRWMQWAMKVVVVIGDSGVLQGVKCGDILLAYRPKSTMIIGVLRTS